VSQQPFVKFEAYQNNTLFTEDGEQSEINFDKINKMSEMLKEKLNVNQTEDIKKEKKSNNLI
jgi:UDP-galactopyranose mutase